ncbi:MAG TPA: hypothetical protein G4O12_00365 [Dehalococcoidia bacterium]|nr:hypothetical protein [Dehalococcoidia bacterium]
MDDKRLIIWTMGVVLIAVGLPLFCIARYFIAAEDKKKQKASDIKNLSILWMAVGVLIYIGVLISRFIVKP